MRDRRRLRCQLVSVCWSQSDISFLIAFQNQGAKSGTLTPKTLNSLTAIAGHEGDEEEWEREIGGYSVHEEEVNLIVIHYASY